MSAFKYYIIPPPAELAYYVRAYWVFEGSGIGDQPYVYRSMADACAEIVFHYKSNWPRISETNQIIPGTDKVAALQSPTARYQRFVTNSDFGIFGAYIYPYAIPDLFNLSASELSNQMPSFADCIGKNGRSLQERILHANDNHERASILSAFLTKQLRQKAQKPTTIHACIKQIIHSPGPSRIDKIASDFCISARQLERKFKTITGYSPKHFSRISRFQQALRNYGGNYKSLTDIAYDCGYYDQSHFIHDFREFSGYEPGNYFSGRAEGIEYRENQV